MSRLHDVLVFIPMHVLARFSTGYMANFLLSAGSPSLWELYTISLTVWYPRRNKAAECSFKKHWQGVAHRTLRLPQWLPRTCQAIMPQLAKCLGCVYVSVVVVVVCVGGGGGGCHIIEEGLHVSRGGRSARGGLCQKDVIMTALAPLESRHPRLGQSLWWLWVMSPQCLHAHAAPAGVLVCPVGRPGEVSLPSVASFPCVCVCVCFLCISL